MEVTTLFIKTGSANTLYPTQLSGGLKNTTLTAESPEHQNRAYGHSFCGVLAAQVLRADEEG